MKWVASSCVENVAVAALAPHAWAIETIERYGGAGIAVGEDGRGDATPRGTGDTPQLEAATATTTSTAVRSRWPNANERPRCVMNGLASRSYMATLVLFTLYTPIGSCSLHQTGARTIRCNLTA